MANMFSFDYFINPHDVIYDMTTDEEVDAAYEKMVNHKNKKMISSGAVMHSLWRTVKNNLHTVRFKVKSVSG